MNRTLYRTDIAPDAAGWTSDDERWEAVTRREPQAD